MLAILPVPPQFGAGCAAEPSTCPSLIFARHLRLHQCQRGPGVCCVDPQEIDAAAIASDTALAACPAASHREVWSSGADAAYLKPGGVRGQPRLRRC
jgi:hypothetical protein